MSTPDERTRALAWAGAFLVQISRDRDLPLDVRRQATVIARHFPTIEELGRSPAQVDRIELSGDLKCPGGSEAWCKELQYGPLRDSTRLHWPD
jgi:hypothetical protein